MDIIKKVFMYRTWREERKKKRVMELFKKPARPYLPNFKNLTILFLIIFVILIAYMYTKSENMTRNECMIMPGVECSNVYASDTSITFEVSNYLKEDMNITLTLEDCEGSVTHVIKPNKLAEYEFSCNNEKKTISKQIGIEYTGYSGLAHNKTGHLTAQKEQI